MRNENGLRRVSTAHLGLGKPNYCILKTSKSSTGDIFAFNKLEAHFNFYGFIFLTSLWGCPLQAPPAPHPRRAEKRWNYICPSFCPHQNSAWGEKRATTESQTNWPQIEQDSVRKPQQEKKKKKKERKTTSLLVVKIEYRLEKDMVHPWRALPNVSNWQRRVSDGHQRSSLIQKEHAVLFLKNLHTPQSVVYFIPTEEIKETSVTGNTFWRRSLICEE